MNSRNLTRRGRWGSAAVLSLTAALLALSNGRAMAQSNESGSENGLVGVWIVEVTLRDCTSGAALGPAFNSIVTFHRGGTATESAGGTAFAPGQRSSGHGTWAQSERQTYDQKMVALILFDTQPNLPGTPGFNPALPVSPGFFAGWSIVRHSLQLTDANHATSSGTNGFYRANGQLYRSGCSTATAQRFE
jgi:hypothetical protein